MFRTGQNAYRHSCCESVPDGRKGAVPLDGHEDRRRGSGKVYTITLDGTMTTTDRRQCGRSKA
jgi:hypothetical protein